MNTVYNPLTGEWERIDDVVRPLPVIARDTRLVVANDTTPFTPTLATGSVWSQTDIFGNSNGARANIGIAGGNAGVDIVIPDPWRIRRIIVMFVRSGTGGTSVNIGCALFGRLIAPDGTTTDSWRTIATAVDTLGVGVPVPTRIVLPNSLAGVLGFDQYRITFRRDPDSNPAPQLSLIRVYAEF